MKLIFQKDSFVQPFHSEWDVVVPSGLFCLPRFHTFPYGSIPYICIFADICCHIHCNVELTCLSSSYDRADFIYWLVLFVAENQAYIFVICTWLYCTYPIFSFSSYLFTQWWKIWFLFCISHRIYKLKKAFIDAGVYNIYYTQLCVRWADFGSESLSYVRSSCRVIAKILAPIAVKRGSKWCIKQKYAEGVAKDVSICGWEKSYRDLKSSSHYI